MEREEPLNNVSFAIPSLFEEFQVICRTYLIFASKLGEITSGRTQRVIDFCEFVMDNKPLGQEQSIQRALVNIVTEYQDDLKSGILIRMNNDLVSPGAFFRKNESVCIDIEPNYHFNLANMFLSIKTSDVPEKEEVISYILDALSRVLIRALLHSNVSKYTRETICINTIQMHLPNPYP